MTKNLTWQREYKESDWLYETNDDNTARFVLGVKGVTPLICFGVNPSTAEPKSPDDTLCRVEKLAYKKAHDSWIMFNIYPQRATAPKNLHDTVNYTLHKQNIEHIENVLKQGNLKLWAAWGDVIFKRTYLKGCLRNINDIAIRYGCQWVSLGGKKPFHPLCRTEGFDLYNTPLLPFNINPYIT